MTPHQSTEWGAFVWLIAILIAIGGAYVGLVVIGTLAVSALALVVRVFLFVSGAGG